MKPNQAGDAPETRLTSSGMFQKRLICLIANEVEHQQPTKTGLKHTIHFALQHLGQAMHCIG
jgi:hypothetical protein